MSAPRGTAAEIRELRAQVAALAADAAQIAEALLSIKSTLAVAGAAWQDGFEKGQASMRPAASAAPGRPTRDRHGLRVAGGTAGGAA